MNTQFPLREKRKAETRKRFIDSARVLFAQRGYDATTLEEIAAHAGLHVQTLYRHFASKQELATAGEQDHLVKFREAIRNPDRREDTFTFWRNWVHASATRVTRDGGRRYREYLIQRQNQPLVSAQLMNIGQEYQDLLAESLARDLGTDADSIDTARLIAIMLWGVNAHVLRLHREDSNHNLVREAVAAIDRIQGMFDHLVRSKAG